MAAALVDAAGLPDSPVDAAAEFHARIAPEVRRAAAGGGDAVVLFAPVDTTHRAWRLAAIQGLARESAPSRINGVVAAAAEEPERAQVLDYLRNAPGVTGQILEVDGILAEND